MGRILYLDESGITNDEDADPYMIVAGVMLHTDSQWRAVRDALQKVADDWLPPQGRKGFIFHAKDIYHGNKSWDRDVWPAEIRNQILIELVEITHTLKIPIFAQYVEKKTYGVGILTAEQLSYPHKAVQMQGICALDCVVWADRWLERYAPDENATVTAEDKTDVREVIRNMHVVLKNSKLMESNGLGVIEGLPLKRIIDGISFQRKNEAVALQLADACAFVLKRGLGKLHIPAPLFDYLQRAILLARVHTKTELATVAGLKAGYDASGLVS